MALLKPKEDDTKDKPTLESVLTERKTQRDEAHSFEVRNTAAWETIADEMTAIRVHLTGKV